MRKALGPIGARLHSDRSAIWIDPRIPLTDAYDLSTGELLDDIDIRDPEFRDWLRALRMQQDAAAEGAQQAAPINAQTKAPSPALPDARALVPNRRTAWSGRLSIAPRLAVIWESEDVARAGNRVIQAVCDTAPVGSGGSSLLTLNRAIRRVFEFDRAGLIKADMLFSQAADSDLRGPALAWRGFARLTEALEFREADAVKLSDAMPLAQEAMRAAPDRTTTASGSSVNG